MQQVSPFDFRVVNRFLSTMPLGRWALKGALLTGVLLAGLLPPCAGAQEVRLDETYTSPNAEEKGLFGAAVARAGDIDGDGTTDLLVGAPRESVDRKETGRVYLLSGASGKVIRVLTSPNAEKNGDFGFAVAEARDADDDGTPDLLIGASGEHAGGKSGAGRGYLLNGASGEATSVFISPKAIFMGNFGSAVAWAGDADDGTPDLLVGAYGEHVGRKGAGGRTYLFSGASGEVIRTYASPNAGEGGSFGSAVAWAGDADDDGTPDLLIGAYEESPGGKHRAGRVYLLSGASGEVIRTFTSPNGEKNGSFGSAIELVGGSDGDGTPELLVGAREETISGKDDAGRLYRFEVEYLSLEEKASRLLAERHPDLTEPKGEFETKEAYRKRQQRAEVKKKEIMKELRRRRQKKIRTSLIRDTLSIRKIGSYNADHEVFPITIRDTIYQVEIPLKEARSFDKNWRDATVIGYKQLTEDYVSTGLRKYRWFNLRVVHPVTGSRYPIGPQKEIEGTVAAQKQVDPDQLPKTTASIDFTDSSENGRLEGGETATLAVTVKNTGRGPARQVRAQISPETHPHLTYPTSIRLGTVPANSSASESISVKADRKVRSDSVALSLRFEEARGFAPSPVKLRFETRKFIPPELTVADVGIDDASGNGVIEPGEVVDVTARIRNASQGRAENVSAQVNLGENVFATPDTRQSFDLGDLGPGEHRDIKFNLVTNQQAESVPVTLDLSERYGEFGRQDVELPLQFNTPTDQITEVQVEGQDTEVAVQDAGQLSVDIEKNIPTTEMDRPDAVAVVIGIRSYSAEGAPDVEYARRDARYVREYLTQTLGFREGNILPQSPDGRMTYAEMRTLIQQKLPSYVKEGTSEVFVYYSGHGAPSTGEEKQAYLVPSDTDPNFVSEANAYRLERFYQDLARLDAESVTVALDACFTGQAGSGEMMLRQASPLTLSVENPLLGIENATGLLASGPEQVANWYSEKKHGMFTYFFLKGLKGEADLNSDQKVTVREVKRYLTDEDSGVPYWSGRVHQREQMPQVVTQNPDRVLVQYDADKPRN